MNKLTVVLLVGAVLRVALVIVNLEVTTLPQGGADAYYSERKAWAHSIYGREPISHYLRSSADFIILPASLIYSVTGRSPYVLSFVMVGLGLGVVYLAHRAALELWGNRRVALAVAWFVALFPQFLLHSALFLREMPVAFCVAGASLCVVRYMKRSDMRQIIWFTCWVGAGALFHSGVIFAVPGFIVGLMLVRPHGARRRLKFYATNVLASLVLCGAILAANQTGFGLGKFGGSLENAVTRFEQQEMQDPMGGAAYPEWLRVRGGFTDAWKIPMRFVALVFSPLMPFMVRTANHLLGVIDAALYVLLFWSLWRNRRIIKHDRTIIVLLVVMLTLFLVYALGVSNFGTAIRHRAKVAPVLILVAGGLSALRRARRKDLVFMERRRQPVPSGIREPWQGAPIG